MNDRYLHPQNDIILFYFETITASYQHLDQWLIWWMINISIIKMKLSFFYFEWIISIIPLPWPMTDIINDRYLHPQNEIIFFLFRNYYSIISASWPMNDRYLHPQNDIILFYFETITASYQHLDQWLIWWMIDISILKMKLFFSISKLSEHHSTTLINDWYNE